MDRMRHLSTSIRRSLSTGAIALAAFACINGLAGSRCVAADKDEAKVDFAKDVKPILKASCVKCHSLDNPRKKAAADLRLDSEEDAMKGGASGKAIVPGDAENSLLYKVLLGPAKVGDDEVEAMPKHKKGEAFKPIPQKQIDVIKHWIDQGAKWSK